MQEKNGDGEPSVLQALIDANDQPVFALDCELRYTAFNRAHAVAMRALYGCEIAVGGRLLDYQTVASDRVAAAANLERAMGGERVTVTACAGDGRHRRSFEIAHTPLTDASGIVVGVGVRTRDITEQERAEERLRESETDLEVILECAADGILAVTKTGRILRANRRFAELWRIPEAILESRDDEVLLAFVLDQLADPGDFMKRVRELYESDATVVETLKLKDGRVFERHSTATTQGSAVTGRVWSFSDISEQVHARSDLQERTRALETLMGNLPGMAYRCAHDPQRTMEFVSAGCEELTGYAPEELIQNARIAFAEVIAPEHREPAWESIEHAVDREDRWTITYPIVTADDGRKWVWERGVAVRDAEGDIVALEGLIADITAQHEAEEQLEGALDEWRATFDAMPDSVALFDAAGNIRRVNAATAQLTGRTYADIVGRPCFEVFHGTNAVHPDCPHQRALRSRRPEVRLTEQDGRWRRMTFQPIYGRNGAYSGGVHLVSDVTELEAARRRLLESVTKQEAITEGVISAIAVTTEIRDPYTAGHQRRVAELAAAIARELGFEANRVAGVQVAATVHDVGKITVPAEVLSKPGRLSETEFELIKGHARASHDVLSPIAFPWPVAEAALQHHERIDGSGYPQGLVGEAIIEEARIIAVADVVEAMSSHRPYRAALGMEVALDEIRAGAGVRYDPLVVEACLRLIEDQGFRLTQAFRPAQPPEAGLR